MDRASQHSELTHSRDESRVRETIGETSIEGTIPDRQKRAETRTTRLARQRADLQCEESVDIRIEPKNEDTRGRRGPDTVRSVDCEEGTMAVRSQN